MFLKLIRKYLCVDVLVISISLFLLFYFMISRITNHLSLTTDEEHINFDVDKNYNGRYLPGNDSCLIPDFEPRDPSILQYLRTGYPIVCTRRPPLTYTRRVGRSHVLMINTTAVQQHGTDLEHLDCCYSRMVRYNDDENR